MKLTDNTPVPVSEWAAVVRAWRHEKQFTQDEAASVLGLPVRTIRSWEQGKRTPHKHSREKWESVMRGSRYFEFRRDGVILTVTVLPRTMELIEEHAIAYRVPMGAVLDMIYGQRPPEIEKEIETEFLASASEEIRIRFKEQEAEQAERPTTIGENQP